MNWLMIALCLFSSIEVVISLFIARMLNLSISKLNSIDTIMAGGLALLSGIISMKWYMPIASIICYLCGGLLFLQSKMLLTQYQKLR
ncbi:hypothetical protein EIJ81_01005 (plasmid) [Aliivibrio salmonicida]|uniref:hypothetical protein n=1 Tax=Aliivibrio salmonicida TaxID=40269 RepID=UPI000F6F6ABE|nr:hypothetical protein [Aliivibrio salmonicida]AZL83478.1 hypothetical protein EIJ81_01005 [Aliivibrio salmonicida]